MHDMLILTDERRKTKDRVYLISMQDSEFQGLNFVQHGSGGRDLTMPLLLKSN